MSSSENKTYHPGNRSMITRPLRTIDKAKRQFPVAQAEVFAKGRAWAEINVDNLRHNVKLLRALLPSKCKLMPAVKANAYGHGAVIISQALNDMGIDAFCVAALQEGIELRKNGVRGDILILGYTSPEDFVLLHHYSLIQTVIDGDYAKQLNDSGYVLKVHIKIDTGMRRLGIWYEDVGEIIRFFQYGNLLVDGMYTHLCTADDPAQAAYACLQISRFFTLVKVLRKNGLTLPKLHTQGSYGLMNFPDLDCDYARIGIAMYGVLSHLGDKDVCAIHLRPVLSVKARVETVKHLPCGESVGYGQKFTAHKEMEIATIAIGYADGVPRELSCGAGAVLIHGNRAAIVGLICMDQLMVDTTNIPDVKPGDVAVIIGKSGLEEISVCELASQTGSIANEVLSRLGTRLARLVV